MVRTLFHALLLVHTATLPYNFARRRRCDKRLRVLDDVTIAGMRTEGRIIFNVDTTDVRPPMAVLN